MNGNVHCQNLFMWHLKAVAPSEAAKFFKCFYDSFLDTAHAYTKLYRRRVDISAKVNFVGDTPDADKWPHDVFSNADKAREASLKLINHCGACEESRCIIFTQNKCLLFVYLEKMYRFLQLLNEGHNVKMQQVMQTQEVSLSFFLS